MIYFIKIKEYDLVKIGQTNDITSRLAELQVASPFELICIKLISISDKIGEFCIHQALKEKRKRGEWFNYDDSVKFFVNQLHKNAEYNIEEIEKFLKDAGFSIPEKRMPKDYLKDPRINGWGIWLNTERILLELTKLDWAQSDLADKIKMTRSAVSIFLKRRTAPLKTITKIGEALNLDPKDLLI